MIEEVEKEIVRLIQSQIDDGCHAQSGNYPCPKYAGKMDNEGIQNTNKGI